MCKMSEKKLLDSFMVQVTVQKKGSQVVVSLHRDRVPFFELPKDFSFFKISGEWSFNDDPPLHCFYFFRDLTSCDKFFDSFDYDDPEWLLKFYFKRKAEYFEAANPRLAEVLYDL